MVVIVVLASAEKCLQALRRVKSEPKEVKKRRSKEEVSGLFNKSKRAKKDVKCAWKHRFICLAYRDQYRIPTTDIEMTCCKLGWVKNLSNFHP